MSPHYLNPSIFYVGIYHPLSRISAGVNIILNLLTFQCQTCNRFFSIPLTYVTTYKGIF